MRHHPFHQTHPVTGAGRAGVDQLDGRCNREVRLAPDGSTAYRLPPPPVRWVGIWAHPDDEAYLSAGAMDQIIRSGGHVTVIALSDGEAGFPEDDRRSVAERRRHRRYELRAAMAAIGVEDVRFLGLPDGAVSEEASEATVAGLVDVLLEIDPDIVATFGPDGVTGHPDHVACWQLATRAWIDAGTGCLRYAAKTESWLAEWRSMHDELGVWMTEEPSGVRDSDAELVFDLAAGPLDRKRSVMACHLSQTAIISEALGEAAYRSWIAQETFTKPAMSDLVDACVDAAGSDERSLELRRHVPALAGGNAS